MLITILIPLAAVAIVLVTVGSMLMVEAAAERDEQRLAHAPVATMTRPRFGLAQYVMVAVLVLLVIATLA